MRKLKYYESEMEYESRLIHRVAVCLLDRSSSKRSSINLAKTGPWSNFIKFPNHDKKADDILKLLFLLLRFLCIISIK